MNDFQLRELLEEVKDPEVPVLSILDLGVVRGFTVKANAIEDDIVSILKNNGIDEVNVEMVLAPAWTTDWITEKGKRQLKEFGIAPPEKSSVDKSSITGDAKFIGCPQCNSENTEMISQFGSTACKALYRCKECLEPFDYFKCL